MRSIATRLTLASLLLLARCSGFTPVPTGDGGTTDRFSPGGHGPGTWGALPNGFCCTADAECRYRRCIDFGGGKMCSDHCSSNDSCKGAVAGFTCNTTTERCEPTTPTLACRPAAEFSYGSKTLGHCCTTTHDGWSGRECEGNRCDGFGDDTNPYICTHVCRSQSDCPGSFRCGFADDATICWPEATTYSCTP
jgi:hypothetical protein